jgi:hypothetical protein
MKEIPSRLQCAYCLRNHTHGGECYHQKFSDTGCLAFSLDEKGCIREQDIKITVPLYRDIPQINVWNDGWEMNGVETKVKISRIQNLNWDIKKGNLIIYCNCIYYVNEFHESYKDGDNKPKLRIIK